MPEKYGTDQIEIVMFFGLECLNIAPKMKGKEGLALFMPLTELGDEAMEFLKLKPDLLKAQIGDISKEESVSLAAKAKAKYDIPDDKLEAIIEKAFDLAIRQISLIQEWIEVGKEIFA